LFGYIKIGAKETPPMEIGVEITAVRRRMLQWMLDGSTLGDIGGSWSFGI
jgi:hypothetical protein